MITLLEQLADRVNDLTTAHVKLIDLVTEHLTDDKAHVQSSLMSFCRLLEERHTALARIVAHHTQCHHDQLHKLVADHTYLSLDRLDALSALFAAHVRDADHAPHENEAHP